MELEKLSIFNNKKILLSENGNTTWTELIREGYWKELNFEVTPDTLKQYKNNFDNRVKRTDIEISNYHDSREGATGWLKQVEIIKVKDLRDFLKTQGVNEEKINDTFKDKFFTDPENEEKLTLWGKIEFTPWGEKLIREKIYKYISGEFLPKWVDTELDKEYKNVIDGAVLTNRPVVKGQSAITLSELSKYSKRKGGEKMDEKEKKKAELLAEAEKRKNEIDEETNKKIELLEKGEEMIIDKKKKRLGELTDEDIADLTIGELLEYVEELKDEDYEMAKKIKVKLEGIEVGEDMKEKVDEAKKKLEDVIEKEKDRKMSEVGQKVIQMSEVEFNKLQETMKIAIESTETIKKLMSEIDLKKKELDETKKKLAEESKNNAIQMALQAGVPPRMKKLLGELYDIDIEKFNMAVESLKGTVDFSKRGSSDTKGIETNELKLCEMTGVSPEVYAKYNH